MDNLLDDPGVFDIAEADLPVAQREHARMRSISARM
jgi:hypothetical protein